VPHFHWRRFQSQSLARHRLWCPSYARATDMFQCAFSRLTAVDARPNCNSIQLSTERCRRRNTPTVLGPVTRRLRPLVRRRVAVCRGEVRPWLATGRWLRGGNSNSNWYITRCKFVRITANAPDPSVHLGVHTVLPATRTLNPIGKDSSPITTQSSPAVTHCILAAPQFTYPEGMEG
jgi:hypothetical protein